MMHLNSVITLGDLDQVSGGKDCQAATVIADSLTRLADIAYALGNWRDGTYLTGKAKGIRGGGCPK